MGAFDDIFGNSRDYNNGLVEREPFLSLSYDCDIGRLHSYVHTEIFKPSEYEKALKMAAEMLIQQRNPRLVSYGMYGSDGVIFQVNRIEFVIKEKKKQIESLNKTKQQPATNTDSLFED